MMATEGVTEINETLEFEKSLTATMADAPELSLTRLLCAEMMVLCMTYRELLERKMAGRDSSDDHE
ncbi:MAG: hypothetical protein ABI347_02780 [Nitrososphaera sp.]|jgi:hypothetical protein